MAIFPLIRVLPCLSALLSCAGAASAGVPGPATLADGKPVIALCFERTDVRPWRTYGGTGLEFVLLREVERRAGVVFDFQNLPWKRCLAELQANQVDGAFSVSFMKDRQDVGVFPGTLDGGKAPNVRQRLHTARYVLARRKGSAVEWDGKRFHHLQGAVGTQLGYSIAADLRELGVAVDEGAQLGRELLLKLAARRIGAAALSGSEADFLLRNNPDVAAQIELLPIPLAEKPYFLVLSRALVASKPELAARIWKSVETVRTSPYYMQQAAKMGCGEVTPRQELLASLSH